ncbi:hypothetical protein K1719_012304 [Acacia pycnantha]|nr:hypothetical protein K1719_012304 [Acacia pycnantha]
MCCSDPPSKDRVRQVMKAVLACSFAKKDYVKAKAAAARVLQMTFVLGVGMAPVVGIGLYFGAGVFSKTASVLQLVRIGLPKCVGGSEERVRRPPESLPITVSLILMDTNNWRPTQGTEAPMDTSDWRTQLQPDSRQRIVNKIMETLKRHIPFSGQEGLDELRNIAQRSQEKIYTAATSQPDYLRKISLKMLTMETKSHNNNNPMPSNPGGPSSQPTEAVLKIGRQDQRYRRLIFRMMRYDYEYYYDVIGWLYALDLTLSFLVLVSIVSVGIEYAMYKMKGFVGIWIALSIYMALRMLAGIWRMGTGTGPWRFLRQ